MTATFVNPVHDAVLGDPFVLRHDGRYYAYGTPPSGAIPVLTSDDLVSWRQVGTVLDTPPPGTCYWAPEVAYDNGTFHLFYSSGGAEGEGHQVRVATADSPTGPFRPGTVLDRDDPFTIDAHPFCDDDGTWYLFYSRDFLDGDRVGTGIVVDRLVDMRALAGERRTVVRPHADWHVYERSRHWYDRVWDWYTTEGPFVVRHDGRYWCFFSGGAWRADNYGVACAVAEHPLGPWHPEPAADGATVLRTLPGEVIGPGHASIVDGPDNVSQYLVYHAWDGDATGRYMRVDRLEWTPDGPAPAGPRTSPREVPPAPTFAARFGAKGTGGPTGGAWTVTPACAWREDGGALTADAARGPVAARLPAGGGTHDIVVVDVHLRGTAPPGAGYGLRLAGAPGDQAVTVEIVPGDHAVRWRRWRHFRVTGAGVVGRLRPDFRAAASQRLELRRAGATAVVRLGRTVLGTCPDPGGGVELWADGAPAAFTSVALTAGGG